jgi:hypothetical protein
VWVSEKIEWWAMPIRLSPAISMVVVALLLWIDLLPGTLLDVIARAG